MFQRCSFLLVLVMSVAALRAQSTAPAKKLIEFGWDEPDTAFMKKHIAAMEQIPFDGTVFTITYSKPDGNRRPFMAEAWGTRTFTEAELKASAEELKSTPFKKFTCNFLRFDVTPGDVDWFDDFTPIVTNARLAAKVAHEGKAKGLLFDIEQYGSPLFNYSKARDAKRKSFEAYAKQARRRGREVMTAFQSGYPDLTVFLTFGYSLPLAEGAKDKSKLTGVDYGLLAPFLDGMFDAAAGRTRIVDGFEISYGWRQMSEFDDGIRMMRSGVLPLVANVEKYRGHMSAGFGLWLDFDWRKKGWNETDPSKNYFTPPQFEASVKAALAHADEYVWIYTETPQWWTEPEGKPAKLPAAYEQALARAAGK
jgi:hypothetical protein